MLRHRSRCAVPAVETFTPELASDKSPPSDVRYDYGADWVIAPAGLSPARTAAYWAALQTKKERPPMTTIPHPRLVSRSADLEAEDLPEQITIDVRTGMATSLAR